MILRRFFLEPLNKEDFNALIAAIKTSRRQEEAAWKEYIEAAEDISKRKEAGGRLKPLQLKAVGKYVSSENRAFK